MEAFGYVLEWSPSQRAFHVQRLAAAVADNMVRLIESFSDHSVFWPDYVPVAVFPTEAEAGAVGKLLRERIGEREPAAGPGMWPA